MRSTIESFIYTDNGYILDFYNLEIAGYDYYHAIEDYYPSEDIAKLLKKTAEFEEFISIYTPLVKKTFPKSELAIGGDEEYYIYFKYNDIDNNSINTRTIADDISTYIQDYYKNELGEDDLLFNDYMKFSVRPMPDNRFTVMNYFADSVFWDFIDINYEYNLGFSEDESDADKVLNYCNERVNIPKMLNNVKQYITSKNYNVSISSSEDDNGNIAIYIK